MEHGKNDEIERFFLDCFITQTPVWIINKNDDWIGGYLNSKPEELLCYVLERKTGKPVKVLYSNIYSKNEYKGDYSKLPRPSYLGEENEK